MRRKNNYVVIMAGGGGTRLWPLSRKDKPKQSLPLIGEKTLFQATVRRLMSLFFFEHKVDLVGLERFFLMKKK